MPSPPTPEPRNLPCTRRGVLRVGAVGAGISVTGCSALTSGSTPSTSEDGEASPAPSCRDPYSPITPFYVAEDGASLAGFDLSISESEVAYSSTFSVQLTNSTPTEQSTGIKKKYDIQFNSEDGWHSVLGTKGDQFYTSPALIHQPGEGFTWEITLTEDGFLDFAEESQPFHACSPLQAGEYRFVYWGLTSEKERNEDFETDYGVAVPFIVRE